MGPGFAFCPSCGARQAPDAGIRPASPVRRPLAWSWVALAIVIAVVLVISLGIYAVIQPSPLPTYTIDLVPTQLGFGFAEITVAYASEAATPDHFLLGFSVNGTSNTSVPMPAKGAPNGTSTFVLAGYEYLLEWFDVDRNGQLSTGDTFWFGPDRVPPVCCRLVTFSIHRARDDALVNQVSFEMPPSAVVPSVSLANATVGASNATIPVASVAPATSLDPLFFVLIVGNYSGGPTYFAGNGSAANTSAGGGVFLVTWEDNNHNGLLDAGDAFHITLLAGTWPRPGTYMGFTLEFEGWWWLAGATWTV